MKKNQMDFFQKLSNNEKIQHLIKLTEIWNGKLDFITVIYDYLTNSTEIQDSVLIVIYEFLQKLFEIPNDIMQKQEFEKMKKFVENITKQEQIDKKEADNMLEDL